MSCPTISGPEPRPESSSKLVREFDEHVRRLSLEICKEIWAPYEREIAEFIEAQGGLHPLAMAAWFLKRSSHHNSEADET